MSSRIGGEERVVGRSASRGGMLKDGVLDVGCVVVLCCVSLDGRGYGELAR